MKALIIEICIGLCVWGLEKLLRPVCCRNYLMSCKNKILKEMVN